MNADYLRKQAASEEVGQPATLTGDSYTDLRRDGGRMRGEEQQQQQGGNMENMTQRRKGSC